MAQANSEKVKIIVLGVMLLGVGFVGVNMLFSGSIGATPSGASSSAALGQRIIETRVETAAPEIVRLERLPSLTSEDMAYLREVKKLHSQALKVESATAERDLARLSNETTQLKGENTMGSPFASSGGRGAPAPVMATTSSQISESVTQDVDPVERASRQAAPNPNQVFANIEVKSLTTSNSGKVSGWLSIEGGLVRIEKNARYGDFTIKEVRNRGVVLRSASTGLERYIGRSGIASGSNDTPVADSVES
ncbi:hypothetical protein [Photobacterium lutimaris]|uniref:Type IV pilus biogenesis protein PilP n=1 Tax=Photobacterium lutimaris TaxID=388278 RepID=A0A2T3ITZ2_9GAMM|nr:hypothetical protein [Photobacterium lutimaris]PSU31812.1 hypothetical protein C9I99_21750 [Photobacterium lutimaris]TDR72536.1 hypothetical protein DFP78_11312 [Photobacterium lutimaris]